MKKNNTFLFVLLLLLALCSISKADNKYTLDSLHYSQLSKLDDTEIKDHDLGIFKICEKVQVKEVFLDENGNKITSSLSPEELEIVFEPIVKARKGSSTYSHKEILQSNGEYIIDLNSTLAGKFKLTGKYFSSEIYYVTFIPDKPSEKSILEVDKTIVNAGEIVTVYIIPYDKYENLIDATILKDSNPFIVSYNNLTSNENICAKNFKITNIITYQIISYDINLTEAGEIIISGKIGDNSLNTRTVTVNPNEMDLMRSKIYRYNSNNNELEDLEDESIENNYESEPIYRLYPRDKYGNVIEFVPEKKLINFKSYLKYSQQNNFTYNFKLNNKKYVEQRYAEFSIDDDKNHGNNIVYKSLVSGNYDLVFINGDEKILFNITLNNSCNSNTPFRCLVSKRNKCVASQTDCDCPTGYIKCKYMHYCVPENRTDMCFTFSASYYNWYCWEINHSYMSFDDGKCRNWKNGQNPNQKVCPFGKVLCADLSCRDNYDLCPISNYCNDGENRCPDQTCQNEIKNCPNSITCENKKYYVCNNDVCVESELYCEESVTCDSDKNIHICDGNKCSDSFGICDKKNACDHGESLCVGNVCRESCNK